MIPGRMRLRPSRRALSFLGLIAAPLLAQGDPAATSAPRYDRDVRPILADRCFKCHGPDAEARKADLRLDLREPAVAAREDGPALRPFDKDQSEVYRRILSDDPDLVMPPPDSGKKPLSAEERQLLGAWIDAGAEYEAHWSFVPPVRPSVPAPEGRDAVRTEVDAFLQSALEARGLSLSPLADPAAQLRRLYLSLTGLPPEPHEIAAFAQDPSDAAYARIVDRLLGEEPYRSRYAERMASPWLDGARYADTSGIHMDAGRQIWPYRDWVLRAFRDNMPMDRFVQDQLAGDLFDGATQDQKIATGFHRCHVTTDEGGAIDAEYLVEYAVDRVATTGSVFLGLTLGCARCHDHKYDPISQDDFYRVYAYFNSIEEPGLYSQIPDANRALEPFLRVPSPEQAAREDELKAQLAAATLDLDTIPPDEAEHFETWRQSLLASAGLAWAEREVLGAASTHGATLSVTEDGAVLASGPNPEQDHHEIRLRTQESGLRLLSLLALPSPERQDGRVGRAENGNAVLQSVEVEAISQRDPTQRQQVRLIWAYASIEQDNADHKVANALAKDNGQGWAVDAHTRPGGPRAALFLSDAPFGFEGGSELVVRLHYDSIYSRHTFAKVRLDLGGLDEAGLERLPTATSGFFVAGPFAGDREAAWNDGHGPERAREIRPEDRFVGPDGKDIAWRYDARLALDRTGSLPDGQNATYVGRRIFAPTARNATLSLGSDDGFRLYLDGQLVAENRTDRGVARDQDQAVVALARGEQVLVQKIVNTGGAGGIYQRHVPADGELSGALQAALLPPHAQAELQAELRAAWRERFSVGYAAKLARKQRLEQELAMLDRAVPRTMVMKERAERRKAYVLSRGQYDKPLPDREVGRGVPSALGSLPRGAPDDRRGLAQWITAADNPLFARVQMNRLFELLFGTGIVRTSEDFGMQGEWPSHMELLDWLAVEFRESGYDWQRMVRLLARSTAFRQDDRRVEAAAAFDADNRLLSSYPRRRLSAEQIRDQALFAAGLLVERMGGPSVKPYQPPGLWREVAMLQSNTRTFVRGDGDDLYRRSVYTYYKRACPPPMMLAFDAPTREACTIRRGETNTPMQALTLWNDEQFVEAARALAVRAARATAGDAARIVDMHVRCTGREPGMAALQALTEALQRFRQRFAQDEGLARQLLAVGEAAMPEGLPPADLAALSLLASVILNLDETVCMP